MQPLPDAQLRINARLRPELEASLNQFAAWWRSEEERIASADKVTETLYHYTSMAGLLGIVEAERLWFTNLFHLNGTDDHSIAVGIAHEILRHKSRSSSVAKEFCDRAAGLICKDGGGLLGPFVASFCSDGGDLEQWRAYADGGKGAALAFSAEAVRRTAVLKDALAPDLCEPAIVARVNYDRDKCHAGMNQAIQRAVSVLWERNFRSDEERADFIERLAADLTIPILYYAATTKDAAHAREKEVRVVLLHNLEALAPAIEARIRGGSLAPYISARVPLRAEEGAPARIVLGPAATEADVHAVSVFAQARGLTKGSVTRFAIPHADANGIAGG
jgi:hypothetical protein